MDKQFWISIMKSDYEIPAGYSVLTLTDELFSTIGSTDSELRDSIGLEVFYNWLKKGFFSADDLRRFTLELIGNLQKGIGEDEGDSVFLRSFSALWLSLIIDRDNEVLQLEQKDIASILDAALEYFTMEKDLRGYVPVKGYAHALAHASDLFGALAESKLTGAEEHLKILGCIARKMEHSTSGVFLYNEESRLARAVIGIFARATLSIDQIKDWLTSLRNPWNGAWQDRELTIAYNNGRNFLRSLYLQILFSKGENIPNQEQLLGLLQNTFEQAKPWEWTANE